MFEGHSPVVEGRSLVEEHSLVAEGDIPEVGMPVVGEVVNRKQEELHNREITHNYSNGYIMYEIQNFIYNRKFVLEQSGSNSGFVVV